MRLDKLITAAALLCSPLAVAQGWIDYVDRTDRFTANFPGEPDVTDITYPSEYGVVYPGRVHTAQSGSSAYSVTVVDYTDAQRIHLERSNATEAARGEWIKDVRASVAYAAWNFRQRGGEVTFDAWSDIERVEGHQLQMTNADESRTFAGIYLHDSRLYILEATVAPGWPPPMQFQQSLRFLDEDGKRVRYELAPDGGITRIQPDYPFDPIE